MFDTKMRNHYRLDKDIYDRLNGTIVSYDGEPYYLKCEGGYNQTYIYPLKDYPNAKKKKIDPLDEKLDIQSFELGYLNIDPKCPLNGNKTGYAVYLQRYPQKQYHQGIRPQTISCLSPIDGREIDKGASYLGTPLWKMIKNEYPKAVEAIWMINSGTHESVALSRDIVLVAESSGLITVGWRRKNIGVMVPSMNKVFLKNHEFVWILERILSRFQIEVEKFDGGMNG